MSKIQHHIYDALGYGSEAYRQQVLDITMGDGGSIRVKPVLLTPQEMQDFVTRCRSIGARPGHYVSYNDGSRRPQYWTMPKTIEVEFSNDFHDTYITVRARITPHQILLSPGQMRKIEKELCGISDCQCGGLRGQQEWDIVEYYSGESVAIARS